MDDQALLQSVREAFALMSEREDPPGLKTAVMFRKGDLDDSPEIVCGMVGARAGVEAMREALGPLLVAAEGLSHGTDWNKGSHAVMHGYRQILLDAIPAARTALGADR